MEKQKVEKKYNTKNLIYVIVIVVVFIVMSMSIFSDDEGDTQSNPAPVAQNQVQVIQYEVLREWYPHQDVQAIGMEILISPSDLSEANIVALAQKLSNRSETIAVKVYTSKAAWDAEKNEDYGAIWKEGYIAFYWKRGNINEVRWFQEIGELSTLFGTKSQIQ